MNQEDLIAPKEFTTFAGGFGAVAGVGYSLPLFYAEGSLHWNTHE